MRTRPPLPHTPPPQVELRSLSSQDECLIEFHNASAVTVRAIWLDFCGKEVRAGRARGWAQLARAPGRLRTAMLAPPAAGTILHTHTLAHHARTRLQVQYTIIAPAEKRKYRTFVSHPWIIRNEATGDRMMLGQRMVCVCVGGAWMWVLPHLQTWKGGVRGCVPARCATAAPCLAHSTAGTHLCAQVVLGVSGEETKAIITEPPQLKWSVSGGAVDGGAAGGAWWETGSQLLHTCASQGRRRRIDGCL